MKVRFYLSASAAALVVGLGGPASADPVPQSGGAVLEEVGRTRLVREAVGIGAGELKLKERVALERQPVEALPPLKREPVEVIRRPIEKLPPIEKPVEVIRQPVEALPPLKREPVEVIRRPIEKLPPIDKPIEGIGRPIDPRPPIEKPVEVIRQPVEALPPLKREPVEVIRRPIEKLPSLEKPVELVREPAKVKRRRLEAGLLDRKPTRVGTGKKQGTKIAKVKLKRK